LKEWKKKYCLPSKENCTYYDIKTCVWFPNRPLLQDLLQEPNNHPIFKYQCLMKVAMLEKEITTPQESQFHS
jgi:hypothetical protein